jgi:hypothetical protein
MHMDESHNLIPSNELDPGSASDLTSAVADLFPADLARSRESAALRPQPHSQPIDCPKNDRSGGASAVVYCGSEEEVSQGFLIALGAMGVAVFEEGAEPGEPPDARIKP